MYQVEMQDDNLLVTKVEVVAKTEFDTGGDTDKRGAIYRVNHAPEESNYVKEELVLLKPGQYPGLFFEDVLYTVVTESDIIAIVEEDKGDESDDA